MNNKPYPVSNFKEYRPTRNPYCQKSKEFRLGSGPSTLLADGDTELQRGRWRSFLGLPENATLNLELGAYHGETLIHLAKLDQAGAHVGIEWKYKQCYRGGKKARDMGINNICFLRANYARLPWIFASGEVDRVWILFPDPWSKAAHQKWRTLNPDFFRLLGTMLKEGSELLVKTDHQEYAQYIKESFQEANCFQSIGAEREKKAWEKIPPTPFERIFLKQNLPIYSFALFRNANGVVLPKEWQKIIPIH